MMYHDLYMGEPKLAHEEDFDTNLTTGQVVARISQAVIDGEKHGDELTIVVKTFSRRRKIA